MPDRRALRIVLIAVATLVLAVVALALATGAVALIGIGLVSAPWLTGLVALLALVGIVALVAEARARRTSAVPAADPGLTPADHARLLDVRRHEGVLRAVVVLRQERPGISLADARTIVRGL